MDTQEAQLNIENTISLPVEPIIETKVCYNCKEEKPVDRFSKCYNKKRTNYGKPTTLCKKCNNRAKHVNGQKKRSNKRREFLFNYLTGKSCVDCGETNILVLEFDHLDSSQKENEVGFMVKKGKSLNRIIEEINKCEIVCSNCHTVRTMKRGNFWRFQMAYEKGMLPKHIFVGSEYEI